MSRITTKFKEFSLIYEKNLNQMESSEKLNESFDDEQDGLSFDEEEESTLKSLKDWFYKGSMKNNDELIGMRVRNEEGDIFYIVDFDRFNDSHRLPRTLWVANRPDTEMGHSMDSDELFICED